MLDAEVFGFEYKDNILVPKIILILQNLKTCQIHASVLNVQDRMGAFVGLPNSTAVNIASAMPMIARTQWSTHEQSGDGVDLWITVVLYIFYL